MITKKDYIVEHTVVKHTEKGVVQVPTIFKDGEIEVLDDEAKVVVKIKKPRNKN